MAVVLWLVWAGTAGDTVAGRAFYFPAGCVYDNCKSMMSTRHESELIRLPDPTVNQICYEFTVVEVFAFLNFFCGTTLDACQNCVLILHP